MQQDLVAVSVSIPLLDWGVRKGKYNMARNNLNVVKISARQDEISIEEEVIMTVSDFNIQQKRWTWRYWLIMRQGNVLLSVKRILIV